MNISKEQFLNFAGRGFNTIPLMTTLDRKIPLPVIYEAFCTGEEEGGLLESGRAGRYSYVPFSRIAGVEAAGGNITIERPGGDRAPESSGEDPLQMLERVMAGRKSPVLAGGPDWKGGALGYFSYDMVRFFEKLPERTLNDLQLPEMRFTLYRDLIAVDHVEGKIYVITNILTDRGEDYELGCSRLDQFCSLLASLPEEERQEAAGDMCRSLEISASFSREAFMRAVRQVQDYIRAGDVFQVNLSVRQDFPIHTDPWKIYQTLRRLNPSPYMGWLCYRDFQVVCGSPELLIRVKDGHISTRPIAGTRPRGETREEDLRLAGELMGNEKERAEHIMLVDLERNDLGRVCRFGSVHVKELMVIEEYSHVMHIVSHVEGMLSEEKSIYDAIRACFPGGTITGAPKIRTMEVIEELEPVRRGLYTGSIGWIGYDGGMELNIVIRTLLVKGKRGYVQAGAGIVIDSSPNAEYHESLKKAEALLRAVELSNR